MRPWMTLRTLSTELLLRIDFNTISLPLHYAYRPDDG